MNPKIRNSIIAGLICLVIIGFFIFWKLENIKQQKLDALAQCIEKSGAKFYGAFWCSHCRAQKKLFTTLFGSAVQYLPYIECSTPDTNGQLEVCNKAGIKAYPTWKFSEKSSEEGAMTLEELSQKTNCPFVVK